MKEEKPIERDVRVVAQLPQQEVREVMIDGKPYLLMPIEEALSEMLSIIKEIQKATC